MRRPRGSSHGTFKCPRVARRATDEKGHHLFMITTRLSTLDRLSAPHRAAAVFFASAILVVGLRSSTNAQSAIVWLDDFDTGSSAFTWFASAGAWDIDLVGTTPVAPFHPPCVCAENCVGTGFNVNSRQACMNSREALGIVGFAAETARRSADEVESNAEGCRATRACAAPV